MNTLSEISNKIILCSQNDQLEIIVSLRAFLFDNPEHFWIIYDCHKNFENNVDKLHSINFNEAKNYNENNIKKIGLKPIDIYLLPKNKKNVLIQLIEEIFEDLDCVVIFDKLRINPFSKDDFFDFLNDNKSIISSKIYNLYKSRNSQSKLIVNNSGLEINLYDSCFVTSRKNKIINYWISLWGEKTNYNEPSLIEHLIIK